MITHTPFILENGYELAYHEVWEKDIDFYSGIYTISIGSWANQAIKESSNSPQKITKLKVKYPVWLPEYAELERVEQTVMSHPEWIDSLPKPSPEHIWSPTTETWIAPPEKPIEVLKEQKRVEIKQARTTQEFSGFTWDGSHFDSDLTSQQRISGAVQLALVSKSDNSPYSVTWTLSNNTTRVLSADDMIAVGVALGDHVEAGFTKSQLLQEQLQQATIAEQIAAITW